MDIGDIEGCCRNRLRDARLLGELVRTVTDGAELAVLAVAVPDALTLWGINAPDLDRGFREVVRDRYRELTQAQLIRPPHPLG